MSSKQGAYGYFAAIVAASNGGGAGSVDGDTTTTMMWIDGISPLCVLDAYVAAIAGLFVYRIPTAIQQHRHSPIVKDSPRGLNIDWISLAIVVTAMAAAIFRFPVRQPLRRVQWIFNPETPAQFQLFAALDAQRRVAFLPGVPWILKSLRKKDYCEAPQTLGEHLKKRRKQLGLLQRQAAERMGILPETYLNWEKGHSVPVAAQFRPVISFLGYDPSPAPTSLADRVAAKRRATGMTFSELAKRLGWDEGTLTRYLNGTWRIPAERGKALEVFLGAHVAAAAPRPCHD